MYAFKRNEIILLLGAGASFEAGIPHSGAMINSLEDKLNNPTGDWNKFRQTYNFVKSSLHHADGIRGNFGNDVNYNIESLVNMLYELSKRANHPLYPFIGSWVPMLKESVGSDFELVDEFRKEIIKILREDWIPLKQKKKADYYKGVLDFQKGYQHPLRVFSLNYDMCVETICEQDINIVLERGFEDYTWDWRHFEDSTERAVNIYLNKLHGSLDWQYDDDDRLTYLDNTASINYDRAAIIFGTTYKLQYLDPFLFLMYEFRKWALEARLIISVGYGFGDEHINGLLRQALNQTDENRVLLTVSPGKDVKQKEEDLFNLLDLRSKESVVCWPYGAEDFMTQHFCVERLSELEPFATSESPFLDIDS